MAATGPTGVSHSTHKLRDPRDNNKRPKHVGVGLEPPARYMSTLLHPKCSA